MITICTFSKNENIFNSIAYDSGVYLFDFQGDATYTDANTDVWDWVGTTGTNPFILSIRISGVSVTQVASVNECIEFDNTFFYSDGKLYVHWNNSVGDYSIDFSEAVRQDSAVNISDSYDKNTQNFYNNIVHEPTLIETSGITISADPLKLGMLGQQEISIKVDNSSGQYDNIDDKIARGSYVSVSLVDETTSAISRLFTGYSSGLSLNEKVLEIKAIEQRFFQNSIICRNKLNTTDYPNLDADLVGNLVPVAYGEIVAGICVPINSSGVVKSVAKDITFLVSDPSLGPVRAISKLYDDKGYELTIKSVDLTACAVEWTKPANSEVDLEKVKWQGESHNLASGAYNNGVHIMRNAFITFGDVANVSTVFDETAWSNVAATNQQAIGISIQSERGITEEIIEPVCTSLQTLVYTKGNGQLTIRNRDIDAEIVADINANLYQKGISTVFDTRGFVNQITIKYALDFVDDKKWREYTDDTYKQSIIRDYGNLATGTISPVTSVLVDDADAVALAEEIMETSKRPDKIVSASISKYYDLQPFDIVNLPTQRDAVNEQPGDVKRVEVLSVGYDGKQQTTELKARIVGQYIFLVTQDGNYVTTMGNDFLIGSGFTEA